MSSVIDCLAMKFTCHKRLVVPRVPISYYLLFACQARAEEGVYKDAHEIKLRELALIETPRSDLSRYLADLGTKLEDGYEIWAHRVWFQYKLADVQNFI